jgi:hypothetical protein
METKPKKRGRKPKKDKQSEYSGKNKKINTQIMDNFIIRLNPINSENDLIEPFSIDTENLENNVNNKVSDVCWNCCHSFDSIIYGIPLKYHNKVFYTYGDFCSLECCCRYSIDNLRNYHEVVSLINLYNNIVNESKDEKVNVAPNKLLLDKFGGPLSIEEYRMGFKNKNIHDIKIPPILPIKHNIDNYESNNQNSKSNLKLYRKKPLQSDKKSITNSMNLLIS